MQKHMKRALVLLTTAVMTISARGGNQAAAFGSGSMDPTVLDDAKGDARLAAETGTATPSAITAEAASPAAQPGHAKDTEAPDASEKGWPDTEAPDVSAKVWSDTETPEETVISQADREALERLEQSDGRSARRAPARSAEPSYPSYSEAAETMKALQATYPEGMPWTNLTPYGKDSPTNESAYWFKGGAVKGARGGVGCAAFVFLLSDAVFDQIPATVYDNGSFTYEDIKVSDILRVNNSHFVIVLQKSAGGVIVAEGNYNKSVHWGRAMSKAEVTAANFVVSRYPKSFSSTDSGSADETARKGTEGTLNWTLTNGGTLTISGSGAIPDYDRSRRPSWEADGLPEITAIIIEEGVTGIGDYSFFYTSALGVHIADTVTRIGNSAFGGYELNNGEASEDEASESRKSCLLAVTIPDSVQNIEDDAFRGCVNLTSVSVTDGLRTIGKRAFQSCENLEYIDFPSTITSIGTGAFFDCRKIRSVRFAPSSGNVSIGNDVFYNCWLLACVALPSKLENISPGMFASCKVLTELYIPKTVKQVGEVAQNSPFMSADQLQTIKFEGTEEEWAAAVGNNPSLDATLRNINILFNQNFNNPFEKDPNEPASDLVSDDTEDPCKDGHKGTADAEGNCTVCGKPIGGPANPDTHVWSEAWSSSATHHWHECSVEGCPLTNTAEKDSYGEHSYQDWVIDQSASSYTSGSKHRDCLTCGYRQTESIPATGQSSSGGTGGWSSGGSWGSGSGYIPPSSSGGSGIVSSPDSSKDKDTDTDKDIGKPDTENNSGTPSDAGAGDASNGTPTAPDENTATISPEGNAANTAKAKQQFKTEIKQQLKSTLKQQINAQVKKQVKAQVQTQVRAQLKQQIQKSIKAVSKKQLKAQLKKQLKKQLKPEIKAKVKAKLKKQLKKQFADQFGKQFSDIFNQQFNALFNKEYDAQLNKLIEAQFQQAYKKYSK